LKPIRLTSFIDTRGTICIAQVGIEIPYAISKLQYEKNIIVDLPCENNYSLIVVKGFLLVNTNQGVIKIDTDHCLTIHAEEECHIENISESCMYIIVLHDELLLGRQPAKSFTKSTFIHDCVLYSNNKNEINYRSCIQHAQRIFYLKDVKKGKDRGGHAHRYCGQAIMALEGSFKINIDDGENNRLLFLNKSDELLSIPPYIYASESEFSEDAICLVIASHDYDRFGYIDHIEELRKVKSEIYR